jgi:hypothetical protein
MKTSNIVRCTAAALATFASIAALTPASANLIGNWDFESSAKLCSIGTTGSTGKLIMMYTASGASGMLVVPDDQASITPDSDYPLKISLEGSADRDMTGSAIKFGGSKVLLLDIKAAGLAADAADGFAMRVKLNDKVVFDKDMHGSKDAFAAFVACTKTLTA